MVRLASITGSSIPMGAQSGSFGGGGSGRSGGCFGLLGLASC